MALFEQRLLIARQFGLAQSRAGSIDASPDLTPVLGPFPALRSFVFATGFSGHSFSMGPVAGSLVSELLVDGKTSLGISAFRFACLAEGAVRKPKNVL